MGDNSELQFRLREFVDSEKKYYESIDKLISLVEFVLHFLKNPEKCVGHGRSRTSVSPIKLPRTVADSRSILCSTFSCLILNFKFHKTFSYQLQQVVSQPDMLQKLFSSHKDELKRKCSKYYSNLSLTRSIIRRNKTFFDKVTKNQTTDIDCDLTGVLEKPKNTYVGYKMYFETFLKIYQRNEMTENTFLFEDCVEIVSDLLQCMDSNERWRKVVNSQTTFEDSSLLKAGEVIIKDYIGSPIKGYIFLFESSLYICKNNSRSKFNPSYGILEHFALDNLNCPVRMTEKDVKICKKDNSVSMKISSRDIDCLLQNIVKALQRHNRRETGR